MKIRIAQDFFDRINFRMEIQIAEDFVDCVPWNRKLGIIYYEKPFHRELSLSTFGGIQSLLFQFIGIGSLE